MFLFIPFYVFSRRQGLLCAPRRREARAHAASGGQDLKDLKVTLISTIDKTELHLI